MRRKWILLAIALVLPGLVFVFLKYFGENEFSVPVIYSREAPVRPGDCANAAAVPYRVPAETRLPLGGVTVLLFTGSLSREELSETDFQLKRLANEFGAASGFRLVVIDTVARLHTGPYQVVTLPSTTYQKEMDCYYIFEKGVVAALVDENRNLRGYYAPGRKEMERLAVELKIILKYR